MVESVTIELTNKEQELFDELLGLCKEAGIKVVMRVAGGWVRDKIMQRESDDIDIALDCMYGSEFGQVMQKMLQQR